VVRGGERLLAEVVGLLGQFSGGAGEVVESWWPEGSGWGGWGAETGCGSVAEMSVVNLSYSCACCWGLESFVCHWSCVHQRHARGIG